MTVLTHSKINDYESQWDEIFSTNHPNFDKRNEKILRIGIIKKSKRKQLNRKTGFPAEKEKNEMREKYRMKFSRFSVYLISFGKIQR